MKMTVDGLVIGMVRSTIMEMDVMSKIKKMMTIWVMFAVISKVWISISEPEIGRLLSVSGVIYALPKILALYI
jgi:hypothetical protein